MALSPFLQNLVNQLGQSDTDSGNLIHRLDGGEGYRWTALGLLYEIATGGGTGGGPATIADGADVALGAIADAAVAAGASGTVGAKLRRISADIGTLIGRSGATENTTCVAHTSSGSTTTGAKSVTFLASSDFAGTLLGQVFIAGASFTFRAQPGNVLGVYAFTRSAGTLFEYRND